MCPALVVPGVVGAATFPAVPRRAGLLPLVGVGLRRVTRGLVVLGSPVLSAVALLVVTGAADYCRARPVAPSP